MTQFSIVIVVILRIARRLDPYSYGIDVPSWSVIRTRCMWCVSTRILMLGSCSKERKKVDSIKTAMERKAYECNYP